MTILLLGSNTEERYLRPDRYDILPGHLYRAGSLN